MVAPRPGLLTEKASMGYDDLPPLRANSLNTKPIQEAHLKPWPPVVVIVVVV